MGHAYYMLALEGERALYLDNKWSSAPLVADALTVARVAFIDIPGVEHLFKDVAYQMVWNLDHDGAARALADRDSVVEWLLQHSPRGAVVLTESTRIVENVVLHPESAWVVDDVYTLAQVPPNTGAAGALVDTTDAVIAFMDKVTGGA